MLTADTRNRRNRLRVITGGLVFAATALVSIPLHAQLMVEAGGSEVRVEGVTPGARVLLVGVSYEPRPWHTALRTTKLVAEDGPAVGRVVFDLQSEVPDRSVWVAVDLSTGAATVDDIAHVEGPPQGGPEVVLVEGREEEEVLEIPGRLVTVAVVRPGVDSWFAVAGDGGASDLGAPNDGEVLVPSSAFNGAVSSESRFAFLPGDVVVAVDMDSLRWNIVTLTSPGPENESTGIGGVQ